MIDGDINEFVDQIQYGSEIVFIYQNKKYFIEGWWNKEITETTMVLMEVNNEPFDGYIWEYHSDSMGKCAEEFLNATIWDGKNFMQIQEDVIWSDW